MSENYNLLKEKWIPVLWNDGKYDRVGICKAFKDASKIRQIAASNPMDRVAILRFLLAVLYWCRGNPPEEGSAISGDSFPADWFTKLEEHQDCFNLLGGGKRFYQYKSESGEDGKLTANYLIQEVPTGTNHSHFRHSTDGDNGLCPACCSMGLLRLPVFATSGGRGKPPGINAKPPIYVIPLGSSLADTLFLSWRKISDSGLGIPAWEKPNLQLPKEGGIPLLTGLTWLPRRVWLDNPGDTAPCILCGNSEPLIRQIVFAPIGSQKTDDDSQGRNWCDPHVIRDSKDVVKPSNALDASDSAAGQWAKTLAGILGGKKVNNPCKVWVVSFATVKNDKYLEATEDVIPFFCAPDTQHEKFTMWTEDKLKDRLRKIIRDTRKPRKDDARIAKSAIAAIRPHVEDRVSAKAGKLLTGGDEAWEQAAREYSPMMAVIAKSLSPGFTTAALERRQQIARVTPDMRPKKETDKKSSRKKGGNK